MTGSPADRGSPASYSDRSVTSFGNEASGEVPRPERHGAAVGLKLKIGSGLLGPCLVTRIMGQVHGRGSGGLSVRA